MTTTRVPALGEDSITAIATDQSSSFANAEQSERPTARAPAQRRIHVEALTIACTSTSNLSLRQRKVTVTCVARPWRTALITASCTIRYTAVSDSFAQSRAVIAFDD